MSKTGLRPVIDAIDYKNTDSVNAGILYYVTQSRSNSHASDWWELSYVKFLYPNAKLESQRFSEMLADIGEEDVKHRFFAEYFKFLKGEAKNSGKLKMAMDDGVLIDSTGLPNVSRLPCTAISNHNGDISNEVRLIYAVQQHTVFPLFYRYVPGNIVDCSTVRKTINELKANGVDINWAILDAGYYTNENADAMLDAKLSFITRVGTKFKIYKDAVKKYKSTIMAPENAVIHHQRLYYIVETECMIGKNNDRKAYGYLCLDEDMWHAQHKAVLSRIDHSGFPDGKTGRELDENGMFMLVSSRRLGRDKVLELYYTRDQVEKVFEIVKQYANGLPVYNQTEKTFRGHLLLTFLATVILKLLEDALYGTGYTVDEILSNAHDLQCLVYEDELLVNEVPKQVAEPLKVLGISVPDIIPLTGGKVDESYTSKVYHPS